MFLPIRRYEKQKNTYYADRNSIIISTIVEWSINSHNKLIKQWWNINDFANKLNNINLFHSNIQLDFNCKLILPFLPFNYIYTRNYGKKRIIGENKWKILIILHTITINHTYKKINRIKFTWRQQKEESERKKSIRNC